MKRRRNSINEQWSPRKRSMLESPAYRVMSLAAHRLISRIELELCYHGGNDNGKLPLEYQDFIEYGIHHGSVAAAIREAEALGFIRVTERGRAGNREFRRPSLYYLTFAHGRDSRSLPPTDDWRKIKTMEEAEAISQAARNAKDPKAVAFGHRSWRVRVSKSNTGKRSVSTPETGVESTKVSTPETGATERLRKPVPLSISGVGGRPGTTPDLSPSRSPSLPPCLRILGESS
jgi:hypothetical protein